MTLEELQELVAEFNRRRHWDARHSVGELVKAISIESAELLELTLWKPNDPPDLHQLSAEMADISIYLLALAETSGVDLEAAIRSKLAANEIRFPAHGD